MFKESKKNEVLFISILNNKRVIQTQKSPATAIRRGLKPLDVKTDPRTRLNWW
jgi:hypothetical protein